MKANEEMLTKANNRGKLLAVHKKHGHYYTGALAGLVPIDLSGVDYQFVKLGGPNRHLKTEKQMIYTITA